MRKSLLAILMLSIMTSFSCNIKYCREERSEDAIVSFMEYKKSSVEPQLSVDMDGNMSTKLVNVPAKYKIGFDGKIDFEVNDKDIFERFRKVGEPATVEYNEVWKVTLEKEKEVDSEIINYEFLDAYPKE